MNKLVKYISDAKKAGLNNEVIINNLKNEGWKEKEIIKSFKEYKKNDDISVLENNNNDEQIENRGVEYASPSRRIISFLLNTILFAFISIILISFGGRYMYGIIFLSIFYIFLIYTYYKHGQNFGYAILGLKIVNAKELRKKNKNLMLLWRFIFFTLMTVIPLVNIIFLISVIAMIFTKKDVRLPHDLVSNSAVIYDKKYKNMNVLKLPLLLFLISVLFFALKSLFIVYA